MIDGHCGADSPEEGDAGMAGDVGNPWLERAAERCGHYGPVLLSGSIFAVILMGLRPMNGPLALSMAILVLTFVLASWIMMRQHDRRLCEQCAASMPLNPAEQAARYERRLWVAHAGSQPKFMLPYLAVLIGSNFASAPGARIAWALVQLSMIYLILSYSSHRKLQPWCPWCRGDGGGGDDADVAPPPLPEDRRQLI